jgi:hypothetical protein
MTNKMLFRRATLILLTLFSSVLLVYFLYAFTFEPNKNKNGFTRRFANENGAPTHVVADNGVIGMLCGTTENSLFFETRERNVVLQTDWSLKSTGKLEYGFANSEKIMSNLSYVIDSPNVFLFAKNVPSVMTGEIKGKNIETFRYPDQPYLRSTKISGQTFALRGFDSSGRRLHQVFIVWRPGQAQKIIKSEVIQDPSSLSLASDGILHYDTLHHLLIFVEFNRNEVVAMDTSLHLVYRAQTIDTTGSSRTELGALTSGESNSYMSSNPLYIVNSFSCVSGGKLYVHSLLRADNESAKKFSENEVIDVYDTDGLRYLYSFYLPKYNEETMTSFSIREKNLAATFPDALVTYKL